jgi:hypothetical protein
MATQRRLTRLVMLRDAPSSRSSPKRSPATSENVTDPWLAGAGLDQLEGAGAMLDRRLVARLERRPAEPTWRPVAAPRPMAGPSARSRHSGGARKPARGAGSWGRAHHLHTAAAAQRARTHRCRKRGRVVRFGGRGGRTTRQVAGVAGVAALSVTPPCARARRRVTETPATAATPATTHRNDTPA